MDDRSGSDSASSPSTSVAVRRIHCREEEEDGGDPAAACTGKSCQSCTAGVIADCVAVCCCPCGLVNILALAFLKLPWAVARKYFLGGRKRRIRRRGTAEEIGDSESGKGEIEMGMGMGMSSVGFGDGVLMGNDDFRAEDVWMEMYEVGHLGFGRVSFTGVFSNDRGN